MRTRFMAIICAVVMLAGCKSTGKTVDKALALRDKLLKSNGCSFYAVINADYGEKIYTFSMDCTTDKEGNLTFTVKKPATIEGITGKISAAGGAITFDDKVLAFQTMADEQVTPVSAPWLLIKTLRGGYLKGCTGGDDSYQIFIDDSYEEDSLQLTVNVTGDKPTSAEIFWKGRRVVTVTVENFAYL